MKDSKLSHLLLILVDHVEFRVTSGSDQTFVMHRTVYPENEANRVGDELFCNISCFGLHFFSEMNFQVAVSIFLKDDFTPFRLPKVVN